MITVSNLSFSFTERPLYQEVNFIVGKGQKVGLVGPNGAGKSTLFRVLTGETEPTRGRVELLGSVALVPQEVKRDPEMEKVESIREYLVGKVRDIGDYELQKIVRGMGIDDLDLDKKPTDLSGGQKTKLALARALLMEPEILLLDEPTNFMDQEGKRFVMNFLTNYPKTLLLVSHDLELMDHAIDKVLYVNPQLKTIEEYKGNYSQFKKLREEKDALLKRQVTVGKKAIVRMEKAVTKAMRFKGGKGVRVRVQLQKRLERMKETLPELPQEVRKIKIQLPDPLPVGELPIRAIGVSKGYGDDKVLDKVDFTIYRGERLALIGPNGAGKSTLIKILMGVEEVQEGQVIRSPQLAVGYYSQEFETFDFSKTLLELMEDASRKETGVCRAMLGRFNFVGDKVYQRVESLSGGEKTRLSIALITARASNLLILDEPTTYLDVMSQRIILEAIKEYKGTMLVVSHTPEFIKELVPNRAFLLPEAKMKFWDNELLDRVDKM